VNEMFEIMALMKPFQLNESSVSDAIETPGDFHVVREAEAEKAWNSVATKS
jgi:hypothetical protein